MSSDKFIEFIRLTHAYSTHQPQFDFILETILREVYEFKEPYGLIEFQNKEGKGGLSSYYSPSITRETAEIITKFLEKVSVSPINTRVIQTGPNNYQVNVASIEEKELYN